MLKVSFSHFCSKTLFINENVFSYRSEMELGEENDKEDRKGQVYQCQFSVFTLPQNQAQLHYSCYKRC